MIPNHICSWGRGEGTETNAVVRQFGNLEYKKKKHIFISRDNSIFSMVKMINFPMN